MRPDVPLINVSIKNIGTLKKYWMQQYFVSKMKKNACNKQSEKNFKKKKTETQLGIATMKNPLPDPARVGDCLIQPLSFKHHLWSLLPLTVGQVKLQTCSRLLS